MQFKFRHSKIVFNAKAKSGHGFNAIFIFNNQIKNRYQEITQTDPKLLIDDLNQAGAIINHNDILLVSLGDEAKFNWSVFANVANGLAKYIQPRMVSEVNLNLTEEIADKLGIAFTDLVEKFLVEFGNGLYYLDDFKTDKAKLLLTKVNVISSIDLKKVIANSIAILDAYFLVRDLANSPSNVVTPSYLGEIAEGFTKIDKNVHAEILDEKEIKKLGMNAFLGVAKGSKEEPKFIKLEYKGAKKSAKPIVLVGKGITFDSGGISLKPGPNMDDMKYDMCGAATVLGVFAAVAKLALPVNLVVLVPTCENMPSGIAQKPGDIVKSMSGKTIEILNTDAEGRLILSDALHYAKQFKPEWVIDVATLTGACVIALGSVASGLYVNDEGLYSAIQEASVRADDKVWRMPLFDEYKSQIKGNYGDLLNIGGWGGKAGSVIAAIFLQEFIDYKWAHLDVAGTAMGGSGRPYKLLVELVRSHSLK